MELIAPNSTRVLWLDSDDRTVSSGKPFLIEQGWIVDQARNLVEAIDRISRASYDAVILDLQLPDTLGTDAWIYIRRLQPNIIGVMTTNSASLLNLIRVDAPGLTAYLRKPLPMQVVINTVTEALGKTKLIMQTIDPHIGE
ncbi:MAG: response regulator [Chloroflexi bacterium]|nr:response regulator [Chloroflexota bacterium]